MSPAKASRGGYRRSIENWQLQEHLQAKLAADSPSYRRQLPEAAMPSHIGRSHRSVPNAPLSAVLLSIVREYVEKTIPEAAQTRSPQVAERCPERFLQLLRTRESSPQQCAQFPGQSRLWSYPQMGLSR